MIPLPASNGREAPRWASLQKSLYKIENQLYINPKAEINQFLKIYTYICIPF
jgi:hypothetical protein